MNTQEKIHHTHSGDIHYWVTLGNSDAPWLVFLPGLSADHHLFDQQTPAFPEYNRLVWDAPAHAASRHTAGPWPPPVRVSGRRRRAAAVSGSRRGASRPPGLAPELLHGRHGPVSP